MAVNMENLTARAEKFAIYTPSVQPQSAARATKSKIMRGGVLPKNIQPVDFDFLNPTNNFWHYKWILATAGSFRNERKPNMITNRHPKSFVLGDSGGFQVGEGTLPEIKGWKKYQNDPTTLMSMWENDNAKQTILNWLELNCDYAMTLDMPLWTVDKPNSPFSKLSINQLTELSVKNLQFFDSKRGKYGDCKFLNVLQGTSEAEEQFWYDAVKGFKFEGWSLAGNVGQQGGIYRVLRRILLLREDKLLDSGYDWLHILRLSRVRWSPLITAIQNSIRKSNPKFTISFDSSSPYQTGGIANKYAVLRSFGSNLKRDWNIGAEKVPAGFGFANIRNKVNLGKVSKLLPIPFISPIASQLSIQDLNFKKGTMDIKNTDDFGDEVITNHNVYIYCLANILANEAVFTKKPTAPNEMLEAVGVIEELFRVENWTDYLNKNSDILKHVANG